MTYLVIAGLAAPGMLVEIEGEAVREVVGLDGAAKGTRQGSER